jgi:UDP-N-acetylglucosamine 1-carboxyvinyltransferase
MLNLKYLENVFFKGKEYSIDFITKPCKIHSASLELKGYKHSLVQIIALSIALNVKVKIKNPPLVSDTYVFIGIIQELGGEATLLGDNLIINPQTICSETIPCKLGKLIHGSMYLTSALIMKLGKFKYYGSGGCQIGNLDENGKRPINYIWDVMQKFGIKIKLNQFDISGQKHENNNTNTSIDILDFSYQKDVLSGPLVGGATKTAIILSVKHKKFTILNPYVKTDVLDMLRFLEITGRRIIIEEEKIIIENLNSENAKENCTHIEFNLTQCISEIITYTTLAVINNVQLKFLNLNKNTILVSLKPEFELLKKIGINFTWENSNLIIKDTSKINSINIEVIPRGIQSDHHPFFALILSKAHSQSSIKECVWKDRFIYTKNLEMLGFNLSVLDNTVHILPSTPLPSNNLKLFGYDVRTAAVTLIASIYTKSTVKISQCEHILRGYNELLKKLSEFGVNIEYKRGELQK